MNIKSSLVSKLKSNPVLSLAALLKEGALNRPSGGEHVLPKVLQLPITYHCNSKCVMCNIWQMDWSNEWPIEEFRTSMKDSLFREVVAAGINGGEPTLVKNLDLYAEALLELPSLKHLNIITHGFNQKQLFKFLEVTYPKCKAKGVHFSVIVSLDGFGEVHNTVRGLKVFPMVEKTVKELTENKAKYCDEFEAACTVVTQNVDSLAQLDTYTMRSNIRIKYRLGIPNKRIESDRLLPQYSVVYNHETQPAKEFFFGKALSAKHWYEKFKYYSIFYFMNNIPKTKRLMGCDYQKRGVTVDSRGVVYYCAVASNALGTLREEKGEDIYFATKNLNHREAIVDNNCDSCIHDYRGKARFRDIATFLKLYMMDKFYPYLYRLKLSLA